MFVDQCSDTRVSPASADKPAGEVGAVVSTGKAETGADFADSFPARSTAETANVYDVPFVNPTTTYSVKRPTSKDEAHVAPPSTDV